MTSDIPLYVLVTEMSKKTRVVRAAADYDTTDPKLHVLHRGDMYIGSSTAETRVVTIVRPSDVNTPKGEGTSFEEKYVVDPNAKIEMCEAIENLFREGFLNASDATLEGKLHGSSDNLVSVTVSTKKIVMRNGGMLIPVEIHKKYVKEGYYVPYVIFGTMYSSSNYSEDINTTKILNDSNSDKSVVGRNGLGSKLNNIFSTEFMIDVCDGKKRYQQTFRNNMSEFDPPLISDADGLEPYVQIAYKLDFKRLNYAQYDEMAVALFRHHIIGAACMNQMSVELNGEMVDAPNILQYAKLEFPNTKYTDMIVGYDWPETIKHKKMQTDQGTIQVASKVGFYPNSEFVIMVTPNTGRAVSYVNGNLTRDGGAHVDAVYKACKGVLDGINANVMDKKNKINISYLKKHLSVVVNARVRGIPAFNNNTKTKLTKWDGKVTLTTQQLKQLNDSELKKMLELELEAHTVKLSSAPGGLSGPSKHEPAKQLKKKKSNRDGKPCYLVLTEGDSALKLAKVYFQDDQEHYGLLPLRGKVINARKVKTIESLLANNEYKEIKRALGLVETMDYSIKANQETINYNGVILAGDEDDDGAHIKGLLINLLDTVWPSLVKSKCFEIMLFETVLIAHDTGTSKKPIRNVFYNALDYEEWSKTAKIPKDSHPKYHKGLASFSKEEIKLDKKANNYHKVLAIRDAGTDSALDLAFKKRKQDISDRKDWITAYNSKESFTIGKQINSSEFIRKVVIRHAFASVNRTFVSMDSFKETARKLLSLLLPLYHSGKFKKETRTDVLAAQVIMTMSYHHGAPSLEKMIDTKTQDYPGTNNVPLLKATALFGDRDGLKAGQARYTTTLPNEWWKYMFPKVDLDITKKVIVDGEEAEYEYISQVLPYLLMNFNRGVGTGWSFFIPGCNPMKLLEYFILKLTGKIPKHLEPWARGYKGKIKLIETSKLKEDEMLTAAADKALAMGNIPDDDENDNVDGDNDKDAVADLMGDDTATYSMVIEGAWHMIEGGTIVVTEILLGRTIQWYKDILENLKVDGSISDYDSNCTDETINISIFGVKTTDYIRLLRLRTVFKLSNMYILDNNGLPKRYNTLDEIADAFYDWNLVHYVNRRSRLIEQLKYSVEVAQARADFIKLVNDGTIVLNRREKEVTLQEAKKHGINIEHIKSGLDLWSLTKEKEDKLREDAITIQAELDTITKMSPEQLWLKDIEQLRPYLKSM